MNQRNLQKPLPFLAAALAALLGVGLATSVSAQARPARPAPAQATAPATVGEEGVVNVNAATADELMRGLHQGASFFRKELWRHDLSSGLTTISELGRKGEKGRSVTRSNARLMSALYLTLTHFDRDAVYLGQPPLGEDL